MTHSGEQHIALDWEQQMTLGAISDTTPVKYDSWEQKMTSEQKMTHSGVQQIALDWEQKPTSEQKITDPRSKK